MLIIRAPELVEQMTLLAKEHGLYLPSIGTSDTSGHLAPILAYLDDFGGEQEFKHSCRAILSPGEAPLVLRFALEFLLPGGVWGVGLTGRILFEPGPPPAFRLHFTPAADQPSAA